ncbi:hypothetical protein AOA81_04600 [Methanomassiliicoccales archaeon RumEn M2]|jgi:uncharacterized membrane protein YsdA (DUF1294 family)|nr:hypothetical protein AOA81_04600 [Methanomassiliicoccales archaeon RumEn M2]
MILLLPVAACVLLNVIAALAFASDRRRVVCGERKIPGNALLTASVLGPFGARAMIGRTGCNISKGWFILIYLAMAVQASLLFWVFFYF